MWVAIHTVTYCYVITSKVRQRILGCFIVTRITSVMLRKGNENSHYVKRCTRLGLARQKWHRPFNLTYIILFTIEATNRSAYEKIGPSGLGRQHRPASITDIYSIASANILVCSFLPVHRVADQHILQSSASSVGSRATVTLLTLPGSFLLH